MANTQSGAPKAPTPTELKVRNALLEDENARLRASQKPAVQPQATATPTATPTTQKGGWGMFAGTVFLVVVALFAVWAWMTYGREAVQKVLLPQQTNQSVAEKTDLSPIVQQPVQVANKDSGLPSPDICNINCQKRLIAVHCGPDQSVMVKGIVTMEEFEQLLSNDKVCQTPPPAPPPVVKTVVKTVYVPKVVYHHPRYISPPVEDAPMICPDDVGANCGNHRQVVDSGECQIEVGVQSAGRGYPANAITAWADGGSIQGTLRGRTSPHDGKVYIPVSCSFAYGVKGQVCFGNSPGMARNLNALWFQVAQRNLARGQRVLNANSNVANLWFADN